jgi:hypothetical protein
MQMILIPALITLAITLLRLVGELQRWSETYFNRTAGGGGALIGISWLIPVFGIYFAVKLARNGEGPSSVWKGVGFALLAVIVNTGVFLGARAIHLAPNLIFPLFALTCLVSTAIAYVGWPALGRTLLLYALAARIPVAIVMLLAIMGNWGTHYDVLPPDPAFAAMLGPLGPIQRWVWIGLVPQLTIWIFLTVVGGLLVGTIAAAFVGGRRSA